MTPAGPVAAVCATFDGTSQVHFAFFFFLSGRYRPVSLCAAIREANELMSHSYIRKTVLWYSVNPVWVVNVESCAYRGWAANQYE